MSGIYPLARENFLTWLLSGAGAPAGAADICIIGVTSAYVYSDTHETLADVSGAAVCIAEQTLANVTLVGGVIDADDLAVTGITTGPTLDAFIVYAKWATTEQLLFYIDSATDGTLPQILSTSKMNIQWPVAGIGKI